MSAGSPWHTQMKKTVVPKQVRHAVLAAHYTHTTKPMKLFTFSLPKPPWKTSNAYLIEGTIPPCPVPGHTLQGEDVSCERPAMDGRDAGEAHQLCGPCEVAKTFGLGAPRIDTLFGEDVGRSKV